jgi:DNA-binding MarR family transcriptional regulator
VYLCEKGCNKKQFAKQTNLSHSQKEMKFDCTPQPSTVVNPKLNEKLFIYSVIKSSFILRENLLNAIAPFGIVPIHLIVMYTIQLEETLSQKDLGALMGIDKASMVKFLDELEALKLLQRTEDSKDRRIKMISLTTGGHKLLKKALVLCEKTESEFLDKKLTAKESQTLRDLMKKVLS